MIEEQNEHNRDNKDYKHNNKAEHPEFAAVLEKVQSMNATETLRALIGTHVLERILEAHAMNILLQKVAGAMRNAIG